MIGNDLVLRESKRSIIINGVDLRSFGIELTDYPSILLPPIENRTLTIEGRHGEIPLGYKFAPREFTLSFQVRG
ncbi:MAG: hypothetical protein DRI61_10550, partial [Chloroflexi bacterium]